MVGADVGVEGGGGGIVVVAGVAVDGPVAAMAAGAEGGLAGETSRWGRRAEVV